LDLGFEAAATSLHVGDLDHVRPGVGEGELVDQGGAAAYFAQVCRRLRELQVGAGDRPAQDQHDHGGNGEGGPPRGGAMQQRPAHASRGCQRTRGPGRRPPDSTGWVTAKGAGAPEFVIVRSAKANRAGSLLPRVIRLGSAGDYTFSSAKASRVWKMGN